MTNKVKLGQKIKTFRMSRGMSQQSLADAIGCSQSAIGMYESGRREPDADTIEALADVFNLPVFAFYVEEDMPLHTRPLPANIRRIPDMHPQSVPMIGAVAAGVPILADQEYDVFVDCPAKADFALTVQGDSMEPTYLDGDVIYIREQPDVADGQIAVVLIDDSAALKHVYHVKGGLQLVSENPKYPPMLMLIEDHDYLRILGLVVGYTRMYAHSDKLKGISKGMPQK